ncbi:hypothetical protein G4G28_11955 [Massilia sp. Dwa41.01b]|uniref:glycoside hydrolase family 9 protein n=1 Tax=Massilia sp. Dwa41.01b TaxID=2709302 RepID=UPI001602BDBE|nr:glycoside hydrolase family 9 protein [Massilia sp. Dwa41.01b]QNA89012.1 hypothetical protein G4G28_11955 [Massilia sp. Dwa41.01b]
MYAFASLLTNDAAKRQAYLDAVSQYADFALGLNPLGRSFVTGLGADVVQSPTHLDSYFTKAGLSDGVSSEHVGKPIGNVPGIVVFGPTEGRSGAAYQTAVSNKVYPRWESLPGLRRWADGWSLINGNEFSTWETMVWNVAMHGFLYDAGKDPNARLLPGECTGSAPAAQTRQLACPAGQAGGIARERRASCVGSGWIVGSWQTVADSCSAPPASAQCTVGSNGSILLARLPAKLVCVQRVDTGAQQRVAEGKAAFAAPPAAPGVTVYGFSGINQYGACVDKVTQMSCAAAKR